MDEGEASVASSSDFYGSDSEAHTAPPQIAPDPIPPKRKADELESAVQDKKRKVAAHAHAAGADLAPCAGLPPAIWQHIFLFCPLQVLGRLLRVNRSFHSYLTAVRHVSPAKPPQGGFLRLLKSESVWASARNLHPTKPPKPLPGLSELDMWQLALSSECQFCGKAGTSAPGEKLWQRGPGADGVRVIWPFGIRTCGPCLLTRCQTDVSLLFSTASALRPALPCVFLTSDRNYIPAYTLQAATIPPDVEISKYYYRPHVDEITRELEDAQNLGAAAAEEWCKGLETRGRDRMKVAENWERWEVKYQWWDSHQEPKHSSSAAPPQFRPSPSHQAPPVYAPTPTTAPQRHALPRPGTIPPATCTPIPTHTPGGQPPRGERNLHGANEAKANRKLDIERRAQLLNPPIPPKVLRHMESFKAAIQISQPMSDSAWDLLRPRLLAQFPAAQQAEKEYVSRIGSSGARASDRGQQDANSKDGKEAIEGEWDESQRPVRERLSAIADDFINKDWDHGRSVTFENSPKFAVDLLMHVRRTFYTDSDQTIPPGLALQPLNGPGSNLARPKLVLENMKWVYDNKLKPLTEQFRKELFLCSGSGCEGHPRFYGFEGVIQHYAAKHTNSFSAGNVVVAWRDAEWPEETPFHPDPVSVKHAIVNTPHPGYGSYYGGYPRAGTSTPQMHLISQTSPAPYGYGQYNGPFAPPQLAPQPPSGYDFGQTYPADVYTHPGMNISGPGPQTGGFLGSPAQPNPVLAQRPAHQLPMGSGEGEYRSNLYDKQVSTVIEAAQDIWKQTSGVKDLPNNLRVYVLLHRVISKFHAEFNHEPELSHFIDALSNHDVPRALRNAPGLFCKACQREFAHHQQNAFSVRSDDRRTYTALNLLLHFQSHHLGQPPVAYGTGPFPGCLDWKEDMIELPSDRFISGLIHAPGMDYDKLHTIATVFPQLFPTPLPRLGLANDSKDVSPSGSLSKGSVSAPLSTGTPGGPTDKSTGSSAASPYTASCKPRKPNDDEYDPRHPALPVHAPPTAAKKQDGHDGSPRARSRPRYLEDPRYSVGSLIAPAEKVDGTNKTSNQLHPGYTDSHDMRRWDFVELPPHSRMGRDHGYLEDIPARRPPYRDKEPSHNRPHGGPVYVHQHEDYRNEYGEYYQDHRPRSGYRLVREPDVEDPSLRNGHAQAEKFLAEFVPPQPLSGATSESASRLPAPPSRTEPHIDPEHRSRFTPSPNVPGVDQQDKGSGPAGHHKALSIASTGSRYAERPRQASHSTPHSSGAKRTGPNRRRDRYSDYIPSRYYRLARDDPPVRGSSVGRGQSKRYERYAEQRRRLDQEETPAPNLDGAADPQYSREPSMDRGPPEEPHNGHTVSLAPEYVPAQDRHQAYSSGPPRYRYVGSPELTHGLPPVYVDEYGYEIIRVPRDPRPARGPDTPVRFYERHEDKHVPYAPYEYRPSRRSEGFAGGYMFCEDSGLLGPFPPPPPPSGRRSGFESEPGASGYEQPPDVKMEDAGPPVVPGDALAG